MGEDGLKEKELTDICAFADGAVITCPDGSDIAPFSEDNITLREIKADGINEKDLKNPVMTGFAGNLKNYITKGSRALGHIIITQFKSK